MQTVINVIVFFSTRQPASQPASQNEVKSGYFTVVVPYLWHRISRAVGTCVRTHAEGSALPRLQRLSWEQIKLPSSRIVLEVLGVVINVRFNLWEQGALPVLNITRVL
jgi:hypothetical protein